jgi:hypothetical protein
MTSTLWFVPWQLIADARGRRWVPEKLNMHPGQSGLCTLVKLSTFYHTGSYDLKHEENHAQKGSYTRTISIGSPS